MIFLTDIFGTSPEESSYTNESSPEVQENADSEEVEYIEAAERQVAAVGRADNTNVPLAKLTENAVTPAGTKLDELRATNAPKPNTASDALDSTTQERGANKTVPVGEGETRANHGIEAAGSHVSEVGADATLPSPGQLMASPVTELEAAFKRTQQMCEDFESNLTQALNEQRCIDFELAEERTAALKREEALKTALEDAKTHLRAAQENGAEERRRGDQRAAEAAKQLVEERRVARQRAKALNNSLTEAEQRLRTAKADGEKMQRDSTRKATEAASQLAEERRAASKREDTLNAALSEAKLRLQAFQANELKKQQRDEQKAVEAANKLREERSAAQRREEELGAELAEAKKCLLAKEDEMIALRDTERKAAETVKKLLGEHDAVCRREDALAATLSDATRRLQSAQADRTEQRRRSEQKAIEAANKLTEERRLSHQREDALRNLLAEVNQKLQLTEADGIEAQRRSEQRITDATNKSAEELRAGRQREEELGAALTDAKKRLQANEDEAKALRRSERKAVESNYQLDEDLRSARQREDALSISLSGVEQRLQVAEADGVLERQKTADAINQLAEQRHAASNREDTLNAALSEAKLHLQAFQANESKKQQRDEQKAVEAANKLREERSAAQRREEELGAKLAEAKKYLLAKEDEMIALRCTERKAAEAVNRLAEELRVARQGEEEVRAALIAAKKHFQAKDDEVMALRLSERKSGEASKRMEEELRAALKREEALSNALSGANLHLQAAKADGLLKRKIAANATRQLAEERHAAHQREQELNGSLVEAQIRLKTSQAHLLENSMGGEADEVQGQAAKPSISRSVLTADVHARKIRGMEVNNHNGNENEVEGLVNLVNENSNETDLWGSGEIINNNGNINRVFSGPLSGGDSLPRSHIINSNSNINRVFGGGDEPAGGSAGGAPSEIPAPLLAPVTPSVLPSVLTPEVKSPPVAAKTATRRAHSAFVHKFEGIEVINHNGNVNHNAPHGVINNNNYVKVHVAARNQLEEDLATIQKGLERHHHVPRAVHDAQPTKDGCMTGTRVQLLADAKSHVAAREGPHIVWISGMAGTGKTSAALTLCRTLCDDPTVLLCGTFFCSSTASTIERTDVRRIIPTFATLLVRVIPDCAAALAAGLRSDPDLAHKSIREQVERLLIKPLESLGPFDRQLVFVIDALDQCSEQRQVTELANALADFKSPVPVKFVITSRPDRRIRKSRAWTPRIRTLIELHKLDDVQVTADIRLYIQRSFESSHEIANWYTEDDVDHLATLSCGLFVFSAVAVEFILEKNRSERLHAVKTKISSGATALLEKMYSLVLTQALDVTALEPTELARTRTIIAAIVASHTPLAIKTLADLLALPSEQLREALDDLHPMVFVPELDDDGELRMLHPTFVDFLFTAAADRIQIDKSDGHDALLEGCIRRLDADDLRFKISRSQSSYDANPTTPPDWIAVSLRYACINWARHVELAACRNEDGINSALRRKLLFWLEALSTIGAARLAPDLLRIAASKVTLPALSHFLNDAISFVASANEAIEFSAPHVYISAFTFASKDSLVRQAFSAYLDGLVGVETIGAGTQDADNVNAVAVASNGRVISSTSDDGSLRAWAADAREETYSPMRGHEAQVHSVAISSDSRWTASASADNTVRMWDVGKGELVRSPLRGHSGTVRAVAFSSDCTQLVSGSDDQTIRIWEVGSGGEKLSIPCMSAVSTVSFSPNGRLIAAGDSFGIVHIFHAVSGKRDRFINGSDSKGIASLAFAPDGTTILVARGSDIVCIELENNTKVMTAIGHTARVNTVAYSPDGRFIVSGADDATVRLWHAKTGKPYRQTLYGHTGPVLYVIFTSTGRSLISAGSDGTMRAWDFRGDSSVKQHAQNLSAGLPAERYQDGWLLAPGPPVKRMLYVPPEHRQRFEIRGNSRVIAAQWQRFVISAEAASMHCGEHWTRCWRAGG